MTTTDLNAMTAPALVALFNKLSPKKPVKRFATKQDGIRRCAALLDKAKAPALVAARSAPSDTFQDRGANIAPKAEITPAREGTKTATLIDLLARKSGATLDELTAAMSSAKLFPNLQPWDRKQTRAALKGDVNLKGYGVRSEQRADGTWVYFLVLGKGVKAPLPHVPRAAMAVAA